MPGISHRKCVRSSDADGTATRAARVKKRAFKEAKGVGPTRPQLFHKDKLGDLWRTEGGKGFRNTPTRKAEEKKLVAKIGMLPGFNRTVAPYACQKTGPHPVERTTLPTTNR